VPAPQKADCFDAQVVATLADTDEGVAPAEKYPVGQAVQIRSAVAVVALLKKVPAGHVALDVNAHAAAVPAAKVDELAVGANVPAAQTLHVRSEVAVAGAE